jgi:5-methylcytosine-specific restriction protein A
VTSKLKAPPPLVVRLAPVIATQTDNAEGRDRFRDRTQHWRGWYKLARWAKLRIRIFIRDHFTCQYPGCGHIDGNTSRLRCDHKKPHRGNEQLFWDENNLWTLCQPCHDIVKQREERQGIWD